MTSLDSTSSHLSGRMNNNNQGSLLGNKQPNGSQHAHINSHKPGSSSSSSSASLFDTFAPRPTGNGPSTGSVSGGNNGGVGAAPAGVHRKSASISQVAVKSPVVGGPSSTSPSAASAFDALTNQFSNATLGPNSVSPAPRPQPGSVPGPNEYPQAMQHHMQPMPQYAHHPQQHHPSIRGHPAQFPGHHPGGARHSTQPHHNPNPAVSTMWPRRHGVVKFFNSTKGI